MRSRSIVNGGIIMNKQTNGFVDSEGQVIEAVYCRARKCGHNEGNGKCDITRVDDKVSVDEEGRCENYYVITE